jgi:YesN/AraC family two-component response regulator
MGIIIMYGEAEISANATSAHLNDCSAMFLRTTTAISITLKSATALIWKANDMSNLPFDTRLTLDETSATVIHDVFFEHTRSTAHRISALQLVCHQLQNASDQISRIQLSLPLTPHDTQQTLVTLITNHLQSHLGESNTLHSIAKQFKCSKTEITKSFQEEKGENLSQTLARLKLAHAQEQLQNSDRTISQIAFATGYQDLAGFSHFFKKQTGLSPSEFRDNCNWLI